MRLRWTASMTPFSACLSGPHCAAGDGKRNTRNNSALIALWSRLNSCEVLIVPRETERGRETEWKTERQGEREREIERGRERERERPLKVQPLTKKHNNQKTCAPTHTLPPHTNTLNTHTHTHTHTANGCTSITETQEWSDSSTKVAHTHFLPPLTLSFTLSFTLPVSSTKVAHTHFTFTV
jgi:hypothetical protein